MKSALTSEKKVHKLYIDYASLPRTGIVTRHQNGIITISMLVSLTSFRWETSGDVANVGGFIRLVESLSKKRAGFFLNSLRENDEKAAR